MKFKICLLIILLAHNIAVNPFRINFSQGLGINFYGRLGQDMQKISSIRQTLQSGRLLSENEYRIIRKELQNMASRPRQNTLIYYPLTKVYDMLEKHYKISRQIEVPLVGKFERYKSVGEYEVFKLLGMLQYYNPNAKLYVTIEKIGNDYKETWNRDGYIYHYTTVLINNGEELHQTHHDGRESKFKINNNFQKSEFFDDGWYKTENDGIQSHHKRIHFITKDKFISKHVYSKDGKNFQFTEYFRRV